MTTSPPQYATAKHTMLSLACSYWGAKPPQRCHTKRGVQRSYEHSARWYEAKRLGLFPAPREL